MNYKSQTFNDLKGKKVLVTGASGFIGSAICIALEASECVVKKVGRRQREFYGEIALSATTAIDPHFVAIGDIGPGTDWSGVLDGIDAVVHFAGRVHVMSETECDPLAEFRRVNVAATEALARAASMAGVKRFIFLSTVKVNGENTLMIAPRGTRVSPLFSKNQLCENRPVFTEDDMPCPQDPYAVSKCEAEQALRRISRETDLEVVIIRPPLVYGPRVGANFLRLLRMVDRSFLLPFGLVENRRSMVFVGNLVDVIIICLMHSAAVGQTYMVSDCEDVSTQELVRRLAHTMGRPARFLSIPPSILRFAGIVMGKAAEVDRLLGSLVVDCSKIQRDLGWRPRYSMTEGLKITADWYRDSLLSD